MKLKTIISKMLKERLPLVRTLKRISELRKNENYNNAFLKNSNYLSSENVDSYMLNKEYFDYIVKLNNCSNCHLLDDKLILFQRCPEFMGRAYLDLKYATKAELADFIKLHPQFVGKKNFLANAKGVYFYNRDCDGLMQQITDNQVRFLEEYINQHPDINKLYSHSVNTIRIHTVRNSRETKIFFPIKMRIGCDDSVVDLPKTSEGSYRAFINDDGQITQAFRYGCDVLKVDYHHNTNVRFADVVVPFIKEAKEYCLKAAERFPELRYIGWDIAITENGPIIVEGNAHSAAISTYQVLGSQISGKGFREEIEAMLDFALELEPPRTKKILLSEAKIDCPVYCESGCKNDELLAILIEDALHRNNVNTSKNDNSSNKCIIRRNEKTTCIEFEIKTIKLIFDCNLDSLNTIYEKDQKAVSIVNEVLKNWDATILPQNFRRIL